MNDKPSETPTPQVHVKVVRMLGFLSPSKVRFTMTVSIGDDRSIVLETDVSKAFDESQWEAVAKRQFANLTKEIASKASALK